MATYTSNYNLEKPDYNEVADIGVLNSNMDKIDAKMKELENAGGGGGGASSAANVSYDNGASGMSATNVQGAIDEVFQSVSNGKSLIASAITDKGVDTLATDTFQTMADNIRSIPKEGSSSVQIFNCENGTGGNYFDFKEIYKNGDIATGGTTITFLKSVSKPVMSLRNSGSSNAANYTVYVNDNKIIDSASLPSHSEANITIDYNFIAGDTLRFYKNGTSGYIYVDCLVFISN